MGLFSHKSSPDISAQVAETQRQNQLLLEQSQREYEQRQQQYEQTRKDEQARYDQQLALSQAETARQRAAQEAAAAQTAADTKAAKDRADEKAVQARAYSEGRQQKITEATNAINSAYSGFDDKYFQDFAQKFVDYYKPQAERAYDTAHRGAVSAYSDHGNSRSSAAAHSMGDLNRQLSENEGEIANNAVDSSNSFRDSIQKQKGDALSSIFSSGAVGADSLPDGSDAATALSNIGTQLGAITQTAQNRASQVASPGYSNFAAPSLNVSTRLPGQKAA